MTYRTRRAVVPAAPSSTVERRGPRGAAGRTRAGPVGEGLALNASSAAAAKLRGSKESAPAGPAIKISDQTITRLTDVFKLMADKSRLKILLALAQDGEMHVTAL